MNHLARAGLILALLFAAGSAAAAGPWHFAFNQGIGEYSVGSFAPGASSVSLSCAEGGAAPGSVAVQVRRAGFTPTKGERVTFRAGKRQVTMFTDTDGLVSYGSVAVGPRFRALWQMIRSGGILTVAFGPGKPLAFPLAGTTKLFGRLPCPPQLSN